MTGNTKSLKMIVFLLVLLGFVLPIKAPVSSAKAKLCCMSKGHCVMDKAAGAKISVMGQSKSAKMIACCADNCVSCSVTSILHSRADFATQNPGMSPTQTPFDFISVNKLLFNTGPLNLRRPEFRLIAGIHSPPIFQLNSIFLI